MDIVFIEDLALRGKHGVSDEERRNEQEFLVDIRASCSTKRAAASDKLEDTLDYGQFRAIAEDVVAHNSFYLIERVAESIAERILEDVRVAHVAVTVRKPAVYTDAVPGVTIERTRV